MSDPTAERPTLAVDMPPPDFIGVDMLRGASSDQLVPQPPSGPTPVGTPELGEPEQQQGSSMQYNRPQFGSLLRPAVQSVGMGQEVKQSGSGRAFIPAGLAFPVQSDTPMPDGRRIARPMPSVSRDDIEVIRPPEVGTR
jgi:hypothetical protein